MTEPFEYKGNWRLPMEETWYNGVLRFSPEDGAVLEIFGSFNASIVDRESKAIIQGRTTQGDVTLVDSFYKSTRYTNSNGVTVGIYKPSYIIAGQHFEAVEHILFRSVAFKLFNLFEWIDITGVNHNFNNHGKYSIEYSKPESVDFKYFEGCAGQISFNSPVSLSGINRIEIEEHSTVTLHYDEKKVFQEILMDIFIFSGFITLNTFEQSYPTTIIFTDNDYCEGNKQKSIHCSYQNPTYDSKYKTRRKGEHLINYSDIKAEFPELIRNWYQRYHEIKPVFSLMLYSFRDKLKFSDDKFMDVVRAIETFHRRTRNFTKMPAPEFEARISGILDKVELGDKDWLKGYLEYANEPTLKNRLIDLINNYSNSYIQSKIIDVKRFCIEVVNSRNYYTHYDPGREKSALKGKELFELNQNLMGLLFSCVYEYIGLKKNLVEEGLKRTL